MILFSDRSWGCRLSAVFFMLILAGIAPQGSVAQVLSVTVNKEHVISKPDGVITDGKTGIPIPQAQVSIPSAGLSAKTDDTGAFQLKLPKRRPLIMSVKADGYKPFSLIIEKNDPKAPFNIKLAQNSGREIVIDTSLHHLGDNKFSARSANAGDFSISASGPVFFKEFFVDEQNIGDDVLLKIGSIIGIDTRTAQSLRQSQVSTSASSPVEVFFNSKKVGEIDYNGNSHIFRIPSSMVRVNSYNNVRIVTGVNLSTISRRDYDDIEFIHLLLEFQ